MYWDNSLYARMIFNPVPEIRQATHVLVKGRVGNYDICKIDDLTAKIQSLTNQPTKSYVGHLSSLNVWVDVWVSVYQVWIYGQYFPTDQIYYRNAFRWAKRIIHTQTHDQRGARALKNSLWWMPGTSAQEDSVVNIIGWGARPILYFLSFLDGRLRVGGIQDLRRVYLCAFRAQHHGDNIWNS